MNKWLELVLGLIFLNLAILAWIVSPNNWGAAALTFLKGGLVWIVIMIGAVFIMLGISDLKN